MVDVSIDASIARVRAFARMKGWRKSRLAREAGMSDTVLRHFDAPHWNPTAETLRQIEALIPPDFAAPEPEGAAA